MPGAQPCTEPEEHTHPYMWQKDSSGPLFVRTVIASGDAVTCFDYCVRAGFVVRECFWPIVAFREWVDCCRTNKTASAILPVPYISTCVPSSITRFNGNLKYLRLLLAFLSKKAKRLSRQRAMPMRLVGITVSRLRK
ncbi:hypothetical protein D9M69_421070 [compost metagenome]